MGTSSFRWLSLAGVGVCIFAVSTFLCLQLIPGPHSQMDYLVIGCVSTLFSLVVLFAMLLTTMMKLPNPFYRKRLRTASPSDPPQN